MKLVETYKVGDRGQDVTRKGRIPLQEDLFYVSGQSLQ